MAKDNDAMLKAPVLLRALEGRFRLQSGTVCFILPILALRPQLSARNDETSSSSKGREALPTVLEEGLGKQNLPLQELFIPPGPIKEVDLCVDDE